MVILVIVLAWIIVVAGVGAAVTRPWKSPLARAPLPLLLATIMAAWVLGTGAFAYRDLMGQGAWTGATLTLAFVPLKATVLCLLAYAAGRTLLTARATPGPVVPRWGIPALLLAICLYSVATDFLAGRVAETARRAASPALTQDDVASLVQRIRAGSAGQHELTAFLGNPRCPPELLATYASSPDAIERRAVARNPGIDAALAEKLVADPDEEVRYYLAFNRTLPPPVLSRLAADTSDMVRDMVVWTKTLPDDALNRLAEDPSPKVRATVAIQNRISAAVLAKLRNDPEARVRDAANRNNRSE